VGTIRRFEDLEAWKLARELANAIYRVTSDGSFARDFALRDQIRRAAISVISNISEGFERSGDAEFIQFLHMAKGSCGEVRCQLYLARDQDYISKESFESLLSQCMSVSKLVSGLIKYLRASELKGSKYQ
jgi:four helix bundle protein